MNLLIESIVGPACRLHILTPPLLIKLIKPIGMAFTFFRHVKGQPVEIASFQQASLLESMHKFHMNQQASIITSTMYFQPS